MSGTKGDPQQGEESSAFRTFVPSSAARSRDADVTLEAVSDDAVSGLEVPNAKPLCYEFPGGQPGRPG
jgi:hypothetical protein